MDGLMLTYPFKSPPPNLSNLVLVDLTFNFDDPKNDDFESKLDEIPMKPGAKM